jgi:hypothetical protein
MAGKKTKNPVAKPVVAAAKAAPVAEVKKAVRKAPLRKTPTRVAELGDVPPTLTAPGIENFTVNAAVDGAQESKMGAMRDVIAGMPKDESVALLRNLLQQQGVKAAEPTTASPDEELVKDWRDGGYPYKNLMQRRNYERQKYRLQVELLETAGLGQGNRAEGRDSVRRPRCGRQGRHHQALHGTSESARRARRRTGKTERDGARPMVLPALRAASADQRRDRHVRPLLVQPRRRRTGHGFLQRSGIFRIRASGAGIRAHAGAQWHASDQVLVLGQPGGTAPASRCATICSSRPWRA